MLLLARCLIAAALVFASAPFAWSQPWPVKSIRLVVNFPAGGTTDQMARAFAPRLSETLGQPIVIENRGGAGGNIGLEIATRAAPDGYTLLASSGSPICVGPHLYKLNFDVARDLVPIVPLARILTVLVVRPGLPVRSVAELIAPARTRAGAGAPASGRASSSKKLTRTLMSGRSFSSGSRMRTSTLSVPFWRLIWG